MKIVGRYKDFDIIAGTLPKPVIAGGSKEGITQQEKPSVIVLHIGLKFVSLFGERLPRIK